MQLTITFTNRGEQYTITFLGQSWSYCLFEWFPYCMKSAEHDFTVNIVIVYLSVCFKGSVFGWIFVSQTKSIPLYSDTTK